MKKFYILFLFSAFSALFCLNSCKTAHDIPVIHDTTYIVNTEYQNRYLHDSVYIDRLREVFVKGDTILIHDSIYKYGTIRLYDTVKVTDTCYRYKDKPVEVVREKNVIPKWCWIILIINVIGVVWFVAKKYNFFH